MEGLLQELDLQIRNSNGVNPHVSEILAKIRDRSRYLKTLCGGLVEYTRDADLDYQLHSLRPMVSDALDVAREKASTYLSGQKIGITCKIPGEIEIEACKDRLVQALVNILSNAFESHAGRGDCAKIQIAVETSGSGRVAMTIADTGCGMDSAQLENATKRFRSLKKQQGGIGLGLPLALKIIEREHEGQVVIESEPEAGTTVTINLPMKREHK
jgi:signal transduction histidine kinase